MLQQRSARMCQPVDRTHVMVAATITDKQRREPVDGGTDSSQEFDGAGRAAAPLSAVRSLRAEIPEAKRNQRRNPSFAAKDDESTFRLLSDGVNREIFRSVRAVRRETEECAVGCLRNCGRPARSELLAALFPGDDLSRPAVPIQRPRRPLRGTAARVPLSTPRHANPSGSDAPH